MNARAQLAEQDEFLKQITEGALAVGTVISAQPGGKRGLVSSGGRIISCNIPDGARVGASVRIVPKSSQPLDILENPPTSGEVCTVTAVHGDLLEISVANGTRVISKGLLIVQPGDRVVVSEGHHVALRNLGPSQKQFLLDGGDAVEWDDIGGLEEAKLAIREAIEFPITHSDVMERYGAKPARGVLLYGPPGCGKTMLGKAAATSIQRGAEVPGGFIYIKGPEVLSMWVGESEAAVRALFQQARDYKKKSGRAAVLFIDEAEALLSTRSSDGFRGGAQQTLVPTFLAEMSGLTDSAAFVLLSTNHPSSLDPAVTRDGRMDRKVEVTRPNRDDSKRIIDLSLRDVPTDVENLSELICDDIFSGHHIVATASIGDVHIHLGLQDIVSGAFLARIVSRSIEHAMRRERQCGQTSGVTVGDARSAVRDAATESRHLNWKDEFLRKAGSSLIEQSVGAAAVAHSEAN